MQGGSKVRSPSYLSNGPNSGVNCVAFQGCGTAAHTTSQTEGKQRGVLMEMVSVFDICYFFYY